MVKSVLDQFGFSRLPFSKNLSPKEAFPSSSYAEALADRFGPSWGGWGKGAQRIKAKNWHEPKRWNKTDKDSFTVGDPPTTVFPSLCDWLDDEVPIEWLAEFLQLIHDTPNLHWLLLTKRPENFESRMRAAIGRFQLLEPKDYTWIEDWVCHRNAPTNVSIIVSVENQETADKRIPELLKIPARIRGLSIEPLLGPVDLDPFNLPDTEGIQAGDSGIDWLIIGGESGPGARPCNVEWIRSLVSQGKAAGVSVFVKQLGAKPVENANDEDGCPLGKVNILVAHSKGGDPAEWPEDLRVREFPDYKNA